MKGIDRNTGGGMTMNTMSNAESSNNPLNRADSPKMGNKRMEKNAKSL